MKETRLKGIFSVDFNPIDAKNILVISKYLTKTIWHKTMFELLKKYLLAY